MDLKLKLKKFGYQFLVKKSNISPNLKFLIFDQTQKKISHKSLKTIDFSRNSYPLFIVMKMFEIVDKNHNFKFNDLDKISIQKIKNKN